MDIALKSGMYILEAEDEKIGGWMAILVDIALKNTTYPLHIHIKYLLSNIFWVLNFDRVGELLH